MRVSRNCVSRAAAILACAAVFPASTGPIEPIFTLAKKEKPALIETLRQIVNIESGSRDKAGLDQLAAFLADRLAAAGGTLEFYEPNPTDTIRLYDTPKDIGKVVIARFQGAGTRKIMLLAHMDTVYPHGTLAKQPFRIEGARAFGPGIADDKSGIAVILHTLSLLKTLDFRDYSILTVLINGDEEISSPGARNLIQRIGAEHDFVFSCEPTRVKTEEIVLATSGIGTARLTVHGKAAHAGVNPELGRNALIELAHQILQTNDLSDPARGIKFNWTLASGGTTSNVIPELATASADLRVRKVSDFDVVERMFRARLQKQLIADTRIEAGFERRRPPLEVTDASRAVAKKAQAIYAELGRKLAVDEIGNSSGTDAAFAALSGKPTTLESFGLASLGVHSAEDEYVDLDSIEPRLYLLVRLVMDSARGR
jgi:glutamate carboxypeptidase